MGTMVGLYESALDELCSRTVGTKKVRPKIIASTATVRRADSQIRAPVQNRPFVEVFPPPVPDRRDSFFAKVLRADESNPRLYLGIAAQGRSPKVLLLRPTWPCSGRPRRRISRRAASGRRTTRPTRT